MKKSLTFETITVSDKVIGLSNPNVSFASGTVAIEILLTVQDADIRVRLDGGEPTSTSGLLFKDGTYPIKIEGEYEVTNFKAVRASETNAKLNVQYFYSVSS